MKGVIVDCLAGMVKEKFGKEKWKAVLKESGMEPSKVFLATDDVPDNVVIKVIESALRVLDLDLKQAADAFGDHWVNTYASKVYMTFFYGKENARDFLLGMDEVHQEATRSIANAHPPRFRYEWQDDKTLVMTYLSSRGLIDFLVGLIKGVGKHFGEAIGVRKLSDTRVEIVFP